MRPGLRLHGEQLALEVASKETSDRLDVVGTEDPSKAVFELKVSRAGRPCCLHHGSDYEWTGLGTNSEVACEYLIQVRYKLQIVKNYCVGERVRMCFCLRVYVSQKCFELLRVPAMYCEGFYY